jgi:hypothetical protein
MNDDSAYAPAEATKSAEVTTPSNANPRRTTICSVVGGAIFASGIVHMIGIDQLFMPAVNFLIEYWVGPAAGLSWVLVLAVATYFKRGDAFAWTTFMLIIGAFWWFVPAAVFEENGIVMPWAAAALSELGILVTCLCNRLNKSLPFPAIAMRFLGYNVVLAMFTAGFLAFASAYYDIERILAMNTFQDQLKNENVDMKDVIGQWRTIEARDVKFECEARYSKNPFTGEPTLERHCKLSQRP